MKLVEDLDAELKAYVAAARRACDCEGCARSTARSRMFSDSTLRATTCIAGDVLRVLRERVSSTRRQRARRAARGGKRK